MGECCYVYFALSELEGRSPFGFIAQKIKEFDLTTVTGLIAVFILSVSIALGYIARDIAFAISDLWLRRLWPPTRALPTIFAQIRLLYGDNNVDTITQRFSVFRLAYGEDIDTTLPRSPDSYVREFCKLWLSVKAPALNTEGLEIEINMVMGLVLPVLLSAVVFVVLFRNVGGAILAIVSVLSAMFMMYRITWSRNIETELAIVNFLFAHWENAPSPKETRTSDVTS